MANHKILEKAMLILELAAKTPEGISLSDVCMELDMPKSSVFNLMNTFANMGYLDKNTLTNRFTLGLKTFEVGSMYIHNSDPFQYSQDILKQLVEETGETAHMAVLDGQDIVYINKYDCSHSIRMISNIGKRVPAYATAVGKALLSCRENEEIYELYKDKQLEPLTENTICNLNLLVECIEDVRKKGFATEKEESTPGVQCIALPVKGKRSNYEAAISISVPLSRTPDGGMKIFENNLKNAQEKLLKVM